MINWKKSCFEGDEMKPQFWWNLYKLNLSEHCLRKALEHPEATPDFKLNVIQKLDWPHFEKVGKPFLEKLVTNASQLRLLLFPTYCRNVSEEAYKYALKHPACDSHILDRLARRGPLSLLEEVAGHSQATEKIREIVKGRQGAANAATGLPVSPDYLNPNFPSHL